ncbi:MAG: FAD-binding PCMH-type protein [Ignavibacteria bacterium]|nr:FAD-binding PCMH-type protein [Ignavibacteria bacterium]
MTDFDVITPKNENELLEVIAANQSTPFRFGAGFTDLMPELKKNSNGAKINVINLAKVSDDSFKSIVRAGR